MCGSPPTPRAKIRAMASLPNAKPVTYEEWLTMPEVQDAIEEVVNGEIRIMPAPKMEHQWIIRNLTKQIDDQVDSSLLAVFGMGVCLVIREAPLTTRIPDISVFDIATMVEKDGYMHSPPQLAIEVLSPSNRRREREEKLGDYARMGVPEVWVISPEGRTVEVLQLEDGFLRSANVLRSGILTPKHFPNVRVEIAKIWRD
jgi:Uma2 family endonuclease